jgi:putative ABC transport system permease protein
MLDWISDLRFASRILRKTPVMTAVAVISLGFAIATNTTAFSVASGFLFNSFRWQATEQIGFLTERSRTDSEDRQVAPANYVAWKEASSQFRVMEAYTVKPSNLTGGDRPERIQIVEATTGLFDLLGRQPTLGRGFLPADAGTSSARVLVLTQAFSKRHFGDSNALGESLSLDGEPHTVIGVLPRDFDFIPADIEAFRPVDLQSQRLDHEDHAYMVLARLEDGSNFEDARAELSNIAARLEQESPDTNKGYGVHVQTLRELFPGKTDTLLQYILMTVAGFLLLIACANLINLFLARVDGRRSELALRTALGAGRSRISRQLITETVLVALLGGAVGIVASIWWVRSVASFMPAELPEVFYPKLDGAVLSYGIALSLLAGVLLGIAPALQAAWSAPATALGEVSRGGTGSRRGRRVRIAFIVAETAVALALLTAAGILTDTFRTLIRDNGSLVVDNVLTLQLTADSSRFPEDAQVISFYQQVERRVGEIPGVQSTTVLNALPRSSSYPRTQYSVVGGEALAPTEAPWAGWQTITPAYFETLGVPIVNGRSVLASDRSDSAPVVVVNQSFARQNFPDRSALGERIVVQGISREIVGISADFLQQRIDTTQNTAPAIFLPLEQHPVRTLTLAARTTGDPMALADQAREAVWAVDPDQAVSPPTSLRSHIETELGGPLIVSRVLTMIGLLALALSAIGINGLIAHDVSLRRREIGIRLALGAAPSQVVGKVTLGGMAVAGIGLLLGLPAAWAMSRAISAALEGAATMSILQLLLIMGLLEAVALIASYVPARRAAGIRPGSVLQA